MYGHIFGDQVLASVSQTIQRTLRHNDCFIRYGGEEFVALFPRVNEKRAMEIAERIRHSVEISEIFNENEGVFVKVTISIGVTTLDNTAPSAKEFIERGDKALYIAKKTRNSASLYVRATKEIVDEEHDSYILQSAIHPFGSSTIGGTLEQHLPR